RLATCSRLCTFISDHGSTNDNGRNEETDKSCRYSDPDSQAASEGGVNESRFEQHDGVSRAGNGLGSKSGVDVEVGSAGRPETVSPPGAF
ncbi:hypothetical protein, partial [Mycobacterium sp.]|uniref:hypothetical protein n=1 Tax=Mycobacterium sp. TaxID=1785 RepID=UPI003F9E3F82